MQQGYLFNPVLFWVFLACSVGLAAYLLRCYLRHGWNRKSLITSFAVAAIVGLSLYAYIYYLYAHDNIALLAILFAAGTAFFVTLGAYAMRRSGLYITCYVAFIVFGLLTALTAANNYYKYFPTIKSIFASVEQKDLPDLPKSHNQRGKFVPLDKQNLQSPKSNQGSLFTVAIPGSTSHFKARDAIVYLPPAYDANPNTFFPVLILLNGYPGSPSDWIAGGQVQTTMDEFAAKHNGLAPVVIIPDHNGTETGVTGCVNSASYGNVETYLTKDVVNYATDKFRVLSEPAHWAIGGFSEGGMCATMLTLRNPTIFNTFMNLSGESMPTPINPAQALQLFFGGDKLSAQEHNDDYLLSHGTYPNISGRFFVGGTDDPGLISQMKATYELAKQKGLDVQYEVVPGQGHSFEVWATGLRNSIVFVAQKTGVISQ